MTDSWLLLLFSVLSFALVWATGGWAVRKLVLAWEGTREFGEATMSRLRRAGGYAAFLTWGLLATVPASVLADWAVYGDPDAAVQRLGLRLELVVHLLDALSDD